MFNRKSISREITHPQLLFLTEFRMFSGSKHFLFKPSAD